MLLPVPAVRGKGYLRHGPVDPCLSRLRQRLVKLLFDTPGYCLCSELGGDVTLFDILREGFSDCRRPSACEDDGVQAALYSGEAVGSAYVGGAQAAADEIGVPHQRAGCTAQHRPDGLDLVRVWFVQILVNDLASLGIVGSCDCGE